MKLITWFTDPFGAIIIVAEYKPGKILEDFVRDYKRKNNKNLPQAVVYAIFGQLIGSLKALFETFRMSHRDLKPANVYVAINNDE